jgi:alkanesulfonate monooxygenase SsuD/methylene tetrahydromethanopterin reductase-like flavin-dependent oxidoreductase (luciferase family)
MGAAAKEIADAAVRAEKAGYESIWVSDHLVVPESGGRLPPLEILEPIATLAYVATVTSRIKLATALGSDPLAKFLDRFDSEVRPKLA